MASGMDPAGVCFLSNHSNRCCHRSTFYPRYGTVRFCVDRYDKYSGCVCLLRFFLTSEANVSFSNLRLTRCDFPGGRGVRAAQRGCVCVFVWAPSNTHTLRGEVSPWILLFPAQSSKFSQHRQRSTDATNIQNNSCFKGNISFLWTCRRQFNRFRGIVDTLLADSVLSNGLYLRKNRSDNRRKAGWPAAILEQQ